MSVAQRLLAWYAASGRKGLPWRETRDPYRVLVSEFMLQQTQVDRVLPKFRAFIGRYPDFAALASASTADVVRAWKGLGYNSRAVRLKHIAQIVMQSHGGRLPREQSLLRALPGMGPYTVAAVCAFAFGLEELALDTNIRRVLHRVLFGLEYPKPVLRKDVDAAGRKLMPAGGAHDWNSALMDLGATVCTARAPKCPACPLLDDCAAGPVDASRLEILRRAASKRSPQEALPFAQTTRFARGRIVDRLRELAAGEAISLLDLEREMKPVLAAHSLDAMEKTLKALERDGIVRRDGESFALTE